jgi:hypothetical protein
MSNITGLRGLPAVVLILAALSPLGVALASSLAPLPTGPVAAVFPPWWGATAAFASAGTAGSVIRFGAFPFIVIVLAADRSQLPLHGAWLLLDPRALGGCSQSAV